MSQAETGHEKKTEVAAPQIHWDYSRMETTYANVCNVNSTREEVSVLFGTNQTKDAGSITVELTDRIILNPFAAKRLSLVLGKVINDYEAVFGELPV
jgi:hypothetical protein